MKRNKNSLSGLTVVGFFIFFCTILVTSTASIFIYYLSNKYSNGNTAIVILSVLGILLVGAFACTLCDKLRRKVMIEQPVKKILDATEAIASGDFTVKITHVHDYHRFDQYDLIFDNINTMTAELSKNELLKNDFISNVSHEIKTPLSVIQNYAKSLQNENLPNEKKQEYLNALVIQTKKLSDLISNILKLNKLENQHVLPEIEYFNLSELVRMCAISFENLIDQKEIDLSCDIDEINIKSSPSLIELAINNLISNAIKFTPLKGKISITLKNLDKYAKIQIQDNGCGISKDVGEHIFEKFYQGDKTRSSEGNGLGLSLVKRVIDTLGGQIIVESKVNIGSTFTILLNKE